jgi:hypothetical protein
MSRISTARITRWHSITASLSCPRGRTSREYKPRDKAKVENAVGIVERWILAALRHRRFCAIAELNEAIDELLASIKRESAHPGREIAQLFQPDANALSSPASDGRRANGIRLPEPDSHIWQSFAADR